MSRDSHNATGFIPAGDLHLLIAKLERADGPNGSLDAEIMWTFSEWRNLGGWWREHKITGTRERFTYVEPAAFTGSLDAAVALAFRCGLDPVSVSDMLDEAVHMRKIGGDVEEAKNARSMSSLYARSMCRVICLTVLAARDANEASAPEPEAQTQRNPHDR